MGVLVETWLTSALSTSPQRARTSRSTWLRFAPTRRRTPAPSSTTRTSTCRGRPARARTPTSCASALGQNLLRNALRAHCRGSPIESASTYGGDVRPRGGATTAPSCPATTHRALSSEFFWRAEAGRTRDNGGAGWGWPSSPRRSSRPLPPVSASNAPGGGASFVVRLTALRPSHQRPLSLLRAAAESVAMTTLTASSRGVLDVEIVCPSTTSTRPPLEQNRQALPIASSARAARSRSDRRRHKPSRRQRSLARVLSAELPGFAALRLEDRGAGWRCAPHGRQSEARMVCYNGRPTRHRPAALLPLRLGALSGHSERGLRTLLANCARVGPRP